MIVLEYPAAHSMDTSWYAVDADGHVAVFYSGENGHAPLNYDGPSYLGELYDARHPDQHDQWPGYERAAEDIGFFVYAYGEPWDPIDAYQRQFAPPDPVHVDQFPPAVRQGCKRIKLPGVRFVEAERVQPIEFFPCDCWGREHRVAYVAADGLTVRPIPGQESQFADFVRQFRIESPDQAARYHFEGITDGT
jgi:hypothetical protein